jgi:uncharacterized membrane protein
MSMTTDDAPLAASKNGDAAAQAQAGIPDGKGDSIVARAVTINKPAQELYDYFRNFANLATFMENVERIEVLDERRSHWVVKAPMGGSVEWDAIVTDEAPGKYIAWTSAEGAEVPNSGRVEFRDAGDRGTVVSATILYDPPGGAIGKLVAKMFQREPAIQARRDLNRFKQLMETGEIATNAQTHEQLEKEGR